MQEIERESDENFMHECEQAILDRDEKITSLLIELSKKNELSSGQSQYAKIEKSLLFSMKKFGKMQKWFQNFEEKKLMKLQTINLNLRQENNELKTKHQTFMDKSNQKELKTNNFMITLKKDLNNLKSELQNIKTNQKECGKTMNFFIEKNKEKLASIRKSELTNEKKEKHENRGFSTPENLERKKKKASENTVSTKSSQNHENKLLKDEYNRKSTVIHCILKSLNQKNLLEKLKNIKKKNKMDKCVSTEREEFLSKKVEKRNEEIYYVKTQPSYYVEKCYFDNSEKKKSNFSLQNSFNKNNYERDVSNFLYNKCLSQKNIYSL